MLFLTSSRLTNSLLCIYELNLRNIFTHIKCNRELIYVACQCISCNVQSVTWCHCWYGMLTVKQRQKNIWFPRQLNIPEMPLEFLIWLVLLQTDRFTHIQMSVPLTCTTQRQGSISGLSKDYYKTLNYLTLDKVEQTRANVVKLFSFHW